MNGVQVSSFCKKLISLCDEKNLGAFIVLIDDGGLITINHFPEWSVLQYSEESDKMALAKIDVDTPQEWFKKCENTLNFLTAVSEHSLETAESCNTLKSVLLKAIEKSFGKEKITQKVTPTTTETLH